MNKQKSLARLQPVQGSKSNKTQLLHCNTTRKIQPPFANQIGNQDRLLVFFGGHDCWKLARENNHHGRDSVVLSVGDTPDSKNWKCVRGRSVVCIELDDTGAGNRSELVSVISTFGAREVALIPFDQDPQKAVCWGIANVR